MKTLITHNGSFHADDLFACASLSIYLEKKGDRFEIIRTRDKDTIEKGTYVFDVGGIYNPDLNRFDHHQQGGAGERENKIPYSSLGLIWKHFGLPLCDNDEEVWKMIDEKIVCPIDAIDNGVDVCISKFKGINPYGAEQIFLINKPTWQEDESHIDDIFRNEVKNVMKVLKREIEVAKADNLGKKLIMKAYENSKDKRIIELPDNFPRYLYQNTLSSFSEPLYVIYKSDHYESWKVEAIQKSKDTMENRKPFPESWRGFLDNDIKFEKITGVSDLIFCHKGGFLLGTRSKEGALKLAELALNN